ncbi:MAG: hypothetical protein RM049_32740 [Nostoc sp. DedQUE04]|uniref:hypothetical protein n=1 Tax=Nostoc sp. DedQUE04 TaxID=3075390 RepID=UPI002AD521D6|nr:hypothetical protein [Nostoc sp. DedQUE04]MDZ8140006.1 hypothetical protein [Nostoc sp. DedQUE04]
MKYLYGMGFFSIIFDDLLRCDGLVRLESDSYGKLAGSRFCYLVLINWYNKCDRRVGARKAIF